MSVPMNQLDELEPATNIDEIRELFQITLDRNEKEIELSDEEFGFFFSMIVKFAVDFYNNPQTRSSNEGLLEHCLCDEDNPINSTLGTSISIGITSSGLLNFPPDICEMLTAEKFGCKFVC
ncbi:MAG: hypothetical protein KAJ58_01105 [Candidatus Pacebacteria bacterium]|nr:hypothetical protein [Candidatus Paceibacterota bacterium]